LFLNPPEKSRTGKQITKLFSNIKLFIQVLFYKKRGGFSELWQGTNPGWHLKILLNLFLLLSGLADRRMM
jgi:hypothetical protein